METIECTFGRVVLDGSGAQVNAAAQMFADDEDDLLHYDDDSFECERANDYIETEIWEVIGCQYERISPWTPAGYEAIATFQKVEVAA